MNDPFSILGVPKRFRLDNKQIEQRYRDLSRALHPDKHTQASPAERRISLEKSIEVNGAYRTLKNPQTRAAALLETVGRRVEENARASSELLMEVMELREELDNVRSLKDAASKSLQVEKLRGNVQSLVYAEENIIASVFDKDSAPTQNEIERAYQSLVKLRYLYRFLEEADAITADDLE